MKLATMILSVALLFTTVNCASNKTKGNTVATTGFEDRDEYAKVSERKLDEWEDIADDMKGDRKQELNASISDARAELRAMKNSTAKEFPDHRNRLESRLNQLQSVYNRQAE